MPSSPPTARWSRRCAHIWASRTRRSIRSRTRWISLQVDALAGPADGARLKTGDDNAAQRRTARREQGLSHPCRRSRRAERALGPSRARTMALGHRRRRTFSRAAREGSQRRRAHAERHPCGTAGGSRAARVVRGGGPLRPPDAVRRQLARHPRGHGAPSRLRRNQRRRPARQSEERHQRLGRRAGDASALAAAISGALEDPSGSQKWGTRAGRSSKREFSWTSAVDKTLSLYADLLARGAAAR